MEKIRITNVFGSIALAEKIKGIAAGMNRGAIGAGEAFHTAGKVPDNLLTEK